jgi:dTDP-4-dehydrorhamnose reductase
MLGRDLVPILRTRLNDPHGERVIAWGRGQLDIRDRQAVRRRIAELRPALIVNAAAYTDVDGCESNVELAMAVNARSPGEIAAACHQVGAKMIHFSTDFIFDGMSTRPYRIDDAPGPLSVYGRSKWEGEQAVRAAADRHLIVRTSWLFGPHGRNFIEAILSKAREGGRLRVVMDQIGRPTLTVHLSQAVVNLLDIDAEGTFHFANEGQCSWFEFAQAILRQAGLDVSVEPITSEQLNRPARRPAYSVLDLALYVETTRSSPPTWTDALDGYFQLRSDESGCLHATCESVDLVCTSRDEDRYFSPTRRTVDSAGMRIRRPSKRVGTTLDETQDGHTQTDPSKSLVSLLDVVEGPEAMMPQANNPKQTRKAVIVGLCLLLASGMGDRLLRPLRTAWSATHIPLATPLSELPKRIGSYVYERDLPVDPTILDVLNVDALANRAYVDRVRGTGITLYVGYWGRVNVGMGHGPDVCYKAVGWKPDGAQRERAIPFSIANGSEAATIALHRFTRTGPGGLERVAVAFTAVVDGRFQSSSRGEFWHRPPSFGTEDNPPFLAHVQAVAAVPEDAWDATESDLVSFVQELLPHLVKCFPRKDAPPAADAR